MEWEPFPGSPQEAALNNPADVLGFGGAAGGGKTDLLLGAAHKRHWKTVIYRRELTQLDAIEERSHELFDGKGRYNSTKRIWRLDEGPRIQFAGCEKIEDVQKHQGKPHDLKGFDELVHFTEYQFRFLRGWNRTSRDGQRCRTIATFNPPTSAEGDWVNKYFGPWLDKRHPRPAKDGELRWFAMLDGVEREVRNGLPFWWIDAEGNEEFIEPESRTFIRAFVEDNPVYMASGYRRTLQNLPEPLRSLMLKGDFSKTQLDHPWQVIPTEWVLAAQDRWRDLPIKKRGPLTCIGIDVARGGADWTTYAPRYGNWFDHVKKVPGRNTPNGQAVIRDALPLMHGQKAPLKVDAIGVGAAPVDVAEMLELEVVPMVASRASGATDKATGKLRFVNKRAEWIWKFREALDPDSGEDIALPPQSEVVADLTAPRYEMMARGIKIESKDEIKERIGRSPDVGEGILNAFGEAGTEVVLTGPIIIEGGRRNNPGA